jgi:class 3 adenylate cyclase/tetratricopeptide (TPR) repeat protein
MTYTPKPLDTTDVKLDSTLLSLLEDLALNTHEVWSQGRFSENWVYGPERNDELKTSPCLIPYDELPDIEKQYDRATSQAAIKYIIQSGYQITPPEKQKTVPVNNLKSPQITTEGLPLKELIKLWENHSSEEWSANPSLYFHLAKAILKAGEYITANDIFDHGLEALPESAGQKGSSQNDLYRKIIQQKSLALAECKAYNHSKKILTQLYNDGHKDSETISLLGRICKSMALQFDDAAIMKESFQHYHTAYLNALKDNNMDGAYYSGINAATVALFIGDDKKSFTIATKVKEICETLESQDKSDQWINATLAEANLLLGNINEAKNRFQQSVKHDPSNLRAIASMRRQANLILEKKKIEEDISEILPLPVIAVFSGHMIDSPQSQSSLFPTKKEDELREKIRQTMHQLNIGISYSSAACGADIIFLEEMIKAKKEIHIVLPFKEKDFIKESVNTTPEGNWQERFHSVMSNASSIKVLSEYDQNVNSNNYHFCNLIMNGYAISRAKHLGTTVQAICVWNGQRDGVLGSTSSFVDIWEKNNQDYTHIDISSWGEQTKIAAAKNSSPDNHHAYLPMLFADIKGYSQLDELGLLKFATHFMNEIGKITDKYDEHIFGKKTIGDGLFLVFKNLSNALSLAQELRDVINTTDWAIFGLPSNLVARISLDAGPCYTFMDPVVKNIDFSGSYVIRAARMEPVTPPGHIYASETFVALCNATGLPVDIFDYAGRVKLPKSYGAIQAFHVN